MDLRLNFSLHPSVPIIRRASRLAEPYDWPYCCLVYQDCPLPFLRPDLYSTLVTHYFRGSCVLEGQFLSRLVVREIGVLFLVSNLSNPPAKSRAICLGRPITTAPTFPHHWARQLGRLSSHHHHFQIPASNFTVAPVRVCGSLCKQALHLSSTYPNQHPRSSSSPMLIARP